MTEFSWVADAASGIRQRFVEANGQRFELAEAGDPQSRKFAILLHGFPELNFHGDTKCPNWRRKAGACGPRICGVMALRRNPMAFPPIAWTI
jgi:hypothetical protein